MLFFRLAGRLGLGSAGGGFRQVVRELRKGTARRDSLSSVPSSSHFSWRLPGRSRIFISETPLIFAIFDPAAQFPAWGEIRGSY